jgi:hypothetical protein
VGVIEVTNATLRKLIKQEEIRIEALREKEVPLIVIRSEMMTPHSGQSSQLLLDANHGNAQFLSNLAGQ